MTEELKRFISGMVKEVDEYGNITFRSDPYWFCLDDLPATDFCREIVEPGASKELPDGAVGIRIDCDFWAAAVLPYRFHTLKIEEIVSVLWPHYLGEATYEPDSVQSTNKPEEK